jgi:hypothetical protein
MDATKPAALILDESGERFLGGAQPRFEWCQIRWPVMRPGGERLVEQCDDTQALRGWATDGIRTGTARNYGHADSRAPARVRGFA